jgi:hypothetical protein
LIGITLPYLSRLPGMLFRGPVWLTSYLGTPPRSDRFCSSRDSARLTGSQTLLCTFRFRSARAIAVAAAVGFALLLFILATLDLSSDALAGLALIGLPFASLPVVGLGWLLGYAVELASRRPA